jgi:starch synthase
MKVVLSTMGRFHSFDLAKQMMRHGFLERIFTGFPRSSIRREGLPDNLVDCYPYVQGPLMALRRFGLSWDLLEREWDRAAVLSLDAHVSKKMPRCDAFVGLSGSALISGQTVQRSGGIYLCDRGSSHIRYQDRILREERIRFGYTKSPGIDPRTIDREEAEYSVADLITVPSTFAFKTFLEEGISEEKMRLVPYGVELARFAPTELQNPDSFDVLFAGSVCLRKGVPYLLEAFESVRHPKKSLTFVGSVSDDVKRILESQQNSAQGIAILGSKPQPELAKIMSKSHVLVLPSVEEGFGLVMAQAMATGCPVIASENTGASNLFTNGVEGFITPIRDPDAIREKLQLLADNPDLQTQMRVAGLHRVKEIGGWTSYGDKYLEVLQNQLSGGA